MRGRHAVLAAFGFGGLVAIVLAAAFGWHVLLPQRATSAVLSPSAQPNTPTAVQSPLPGPPSSDPASPQPTGSGAPPNLPTPRSEAVMVYDPENHGVLMFGGTTWHTTPDGRNPSEDLGDTWLWSGHRWTQLNVVGPAPRAGAMAAYDSVRHVVVLFGGAGTGGPVNGLYQDTWTWDGTQWQQQSPAHVPDARYRAAMAFDQRRGVIVMFGGEGATTTYTATWTWDGADWTLKDPATVPVARHFAGMAYDAKRDEVVLFGGSMGGLRFNDTWTWNGLTWARQADAPPIARGFSYLTYDSAANAVVAYVYFSLDNHPAAEFTITWDGTRWTDRSTPTDPSPRADVAIAYDQSQNEVVMLGGQFDALPFPGTWTWNAAGWTLR